MLTEGHNCNSFLLYDKSVVRICYHPSLAHIDGHSPLYTCPYLFTVFPEDDKRARKICQLEVFSINFDIHYHYNGIMRMTVVYWRKPFYLQ